MGVASEEAEVRPGGEGSAMVRTIVVVICSSRVICIMCLMFSRDRNRIDARNTRNRKRQQMEELQLRIQELTQEVSSSSFFFFFHHYLSFLCS